LFFKKADINAHSGRFDKLFVSTQHAPFPFFERNKIRHILFQANWIIRNVLNTQENKKSETKTFKITHSGIEVHIIQMAGEENSEQKALLLCNVCMGFFLDMIKTIKE